MAWKLRVDTVPVDGGDAGEGGAGEADRRWRGAGAELVRQARQWLRATPSGVTGNQGGDGVVALTLPADVSARDITALTIGAVLGSYEFRVTNSTGEPCVGTVLLRAGGEPTVLDERAAVEAVARGNILARATALARDLANTPSDVKSPDWLARQAATVLAPLRGVTVVVRDEKWLEREGFGGVLAVGGGSSRPPRLLHATWSPPAGGAVKHLVLVGKGITFDTGGISIKPADGMHLMKTDMAGGAAVIGAVRAIAELALPLKVSAFVPCAENLVSGTAYRPGDVVTHYGGTTSEVTNTDAEGRMVLADTLSYSAATVNPDAVVDVATLTGAMKIALGMRTGAVFATTDPLADSLRDSGAEVGERWWRLPLDNSYSEAVRSQLADVRQAPAGPGAITAALFLREFTANLPWVHLDIAGPARTDSEYDEVAPVATGFAARTLVAFAERFARDVVPQTPDA